jgi:predicted membrane-bound spermidine synthase
MLWGTIIRLLFTAIVLLLPTFFMGGTLPAAARAIETENDNSRRGVGLLYGMNTLGAVVGCLLTTFFLLEILGSQKSLYVACLLNLLVAIMANRLARKNNQQATLNPKEIPPETAVQTPQPASNAVESSSPLPRWFVPTAAALVGFVFFLMELVWYRMLSPLLGGTIFSFGLILTVALAGIGLGGILYGFREKRQKATLLGFSITCLLEATFIALPYAMGDRVALFAHFLRPLGALGFGGFVFSWTLVTGLVVFPAAVVSGFQFPLLIALLGQGQRHVARQVGVAYAWNTMGAIAGSLAGGFGLLPLLTAPRCWQLTSVLLVFLGLTAAAIHLLKTTERRTIRVPLVVSALVIALLTMTGPTPVWRHSSIGAGRSTLPFTAFPNAIKMWQQTIRRSTLWEAEGIESSVASLLRMAYLFI